LRGGETTPNWPMGVSYNQFFIFFFEKCGHFGEIIRSKLRVI
jgi:hypothetical protein